MRNLRPLRPLPRIRPHVLLRRRPRPLFEPRGHSSLIGERWRVSRRRHFESPLRFDQRQQGRQAATGLLPERRRSSSGGFSRQDRLGGGRTGQREGRAVQALGERVRRGPFVVWRVVAERSRGGHAAGTGGPIHHGARGLGQQCRRHGVDETEDAAISRKKDLVGWISQEFGKRPRFRRVMRSARVGFAFGLRRHSFVGANLGTGRQVGQRGGIGCRRGKRPSLGQYPKR
mmetsp:Transcript_30093/g.63389  ORF Transcript_30093/g.63389 Transcript_30093/m.63389 type:complete len:230 (-) Transcript_30093:414-1103(-)